MERPDWFAWSPDAVHLIQYTSGSTADPKGVAVTVSALAANLNAVNARMRPSVGGVTVSWLPAFHDLGLIQGRFNPSGAVTPPTS